MRSAGPSHGWATCSSQQENPPACDLKYDATYKHHFNDWLSVDETQMPHHIHVHLATENAHKMIGEVKRGKRRDRCRRDAMRKG